MVGRRQWKIKGELGRKPAPRELAVLKGEEMGTLTP
jgi:hypothetical protein